MPEQILQPFLADLTCFIACVYTVHVHALLIHQGSSSGQFTVLGHWDSPGESTLNGTDSIVAPLARVF